MFRSLQRIITLRGCLSIINVNEISMTITETEDGMFVARVSSHDAKWNGLLLVPSVPVAVDPRVANEKAFHINVVGDVQEPFCQCRHVVTAVGCKRGQL